jgi:signal transduction histidine kinase
VIGLDEDDKSLYEMDKLRLNQVLLNLIANAVKFSTRNSKVTVKCTKIHFEDTSDKHGFQIKVINHGPGISEDEQARLF